MTIPMQHIKLAVKKSLRPENFNTTTVGNGGRKEQDVPFLPPANKLTLALAVLLSVFCSIVL